MDSDETVRIGIVADTSAFDRALGELGVKANAFGAAMGAALKGAAVNGQSLDGVLRGLAARISSIALSAALKPLEQIAGSLLGQAVGGVGGAFGAAVPSVTPFAKGGVVAAPTFFPNGRQIGLMGEAGAEAILPLKRGPDGSLGVSAGAPARAQTIVFNVTATDAASFRRSEAQVQAMLARAAERGARGL